MSKRLSILIIDDDRVVRQILQDDFSRKGCDVHVAEDGPSGIEIARKEIPDAVILDWMMPGIDGMEVLERLRSNEKTRQIPVFMLTGKDSGSDIEQASSLGIQGYIAKPFNASEVYTMITDKLNEISAKAAKKRFSLAGVFSRGS